MLGINFGEGQREKSKKESRKVESLAGKKSKIKKKVKEYGYSIKPIRPYIIS